MKLGQERRVFGDVCREALKWERMGWSEVLGGRGLYLFVPLGKVVLSLSLTH